MRATPASSLRARSASEICAANSHVMSSGGGSDTNVFNKAGVKALNLSCGSTSVHTTEESVPLAEMVKAVELLEILLTSGFPAGSG